MHINHKFLNLLYIQCVCLCDVDKCLYMYNFSPLLVEQVECRRLQPNTCPDGYFAMLLESDQGVFESGTTLCFPCHQLCETCIGPAVNQCLTCANATIQGECGESCNGS